MAKIIGLKEKQAALTEVQNLLKSLKPLNVFVATANPANEYTISFEAHKAKLQCDQKEKIDELVRAYKKTIVEKIQALATKYEIELDEDDREIMESERA